MSVLATIGLDVTFFVQLLLFVVAHLVLTYILFKPYFAAYKMRTEKTVGSEDLANQIVEETAALQKNYETEARRLNDEHKVIYESGRVKALEVYNGEVKAAQSKAQEVLQKNLKQIEEQTEKARLGLKDDLPIISEGIITKLLGKESC